MPLSETLLSLVNEGSFVVVLLQTFIKAFLYSVLINHSSGFVVKKISQDVQDVPAVF